jgi:L-fucose isomerase-like protein
MIDKKTTFALFFGNRGFFPASLIASAREEMTRVLHEMGHETLVLDEGATRYGAVETTREGAVFARFLEENRGKFGGVILCLPNFGDETGAVAALKGRRRPDPDPGLPGRPGQDGAGAAARLLLRQDLDYGYVQPVRG